MCGISWHSSVSLFNILKVLEMDGIMQKNAEKRACPKRSEQEERHDGSKSGILRPESVKLK